PAGHGTFLWQIGRSDRTGGEYALATKSPARPLPRSFEKPSLIPADLDFTIGRSWEPTDWYYAQVHNGTWSIHFPLAEVPNGTAYLTVSSSLQQGAPPTVTVNGTSTGIVGSLPDRNDSTIGRQADRSGFPHVARLSFPTSLLKAGDNTIAFTHGGDLTPHAVEPVSSGFGWDTVVLEVDGPRAPRPARLTGRLTSLGAAHGTGTWQVEITNRGSGPANDVRLDGLHWSDGTRTAADDPAVDGPDPNAFPVPVTASLAPGRSATVTLKVTGSRPHGGFDRLETSFHADGGATTGTAMSAPGRW
ncbi:polysaccharide lyase family protein, partial [Streptomyces sulfonofaciens]|uniref:polysaccharide lyase family protein n=1 Tax=Streptomyces sulfonofaciens TaxID=68272 RepID=UPI001E48D739